MQSIRKQGPLSRVPGSRHRSGSGEHVVRRRRGPVCTFRAWGKNKDRTRIAAFYGRIAAVNAEAIPARLAFALQVAQLQGDTLSEAPSYLFIDDGVSGGVSTRRHVWEHLLDAIGGGAKPRSSS